MILTRHTNGGSSQEITGYQGGRFARCSETHSPYKQGIKLALPTNPYNLVPVVKDAEPAYLSTKPPPLRPQPLWLKSDPRQKTMQNPSVN
ncbi:MAG: hypothetical protein ACRC8B_21965 [Aeromonas sobria]|uniref:hypothetical protein n=1 Tax=Aeromonas sobria TaxID=646 RepID=UPI003F2A4DD4